MSDASTCPTCGAALPPDAPRGFCPRCLYRAGLDEALPAESGGDSTLPTARDFGDYELLEEIGHGGMGVVYRARQKSLDRIVALKVLLFGPHASAESVKRFRAEAVATAALQHPNIVAIHEVGFREGQHFIAMAFIEGQPLSSLIRGNPLPARRAALYVKAIAEAIHYAHERGILHRDLKPANVLIDANDQPRVTDFGLAKRLSATSDSGLPTQDLTVSGQLLGSPNYMPPEQATGKRGTLSRRSDVYALGAILYHALTGRPPFVGEGLAETVQQVLNVEPVSPRRLNPSVPADLETVCLKCLEKEPGKRYATARTLAEELDRFLEGKPVLARPVDRMARTCRWCRRNPALASLIVALMVTIIGGFAAVLGQLHRAHLAEWAARKNAYVADMNLARQALEESNLGRARALLNRYYPTRKSENDLRGWEWRWLWQCSQTHERTTLTGASNLVHSVAVSSDGRWLAALSSRDALRLWDLTSQKCVASRPEVSFYRDAILFAVDGSHLFAGSHETASVKVWSVPSLQLIGELRHERPVNWIALSADGLILAAVDSRGVKVWDARERRLLADLAAERDLRFGRVAVSRDGRYVAFSDYEGRVSVWDWRRGETLVELGGPTRTPPWQAAVQDLAFTPDDAQLLCAGSDRTVRLWELSSRRERLRLAGHVDVVTALALSPDGTTLATGGCDQTLRLWDVATWKVRTVFRGHLDEVWDVAFSANGDTLVTASKDETVKLWDARTPPERQFSWPVPVEVRLIVLAADAGAVGLLRADGSFGLLDTATWQEQAARPMLTPWTNTLRIAMDARATLLVATTEAGPLRSWRLPDVSEEESFVGHQGRVEALAISGDGRWLASAGTDHTLRVWQIRTRQQVAQFPQKHERVTRVALSVDGTLIGVAFNDSESEIWERVTGWRRARFVQHKMGHEIAFRRRSPHLITGSWDGTIKAWDLRTLRCEGAFRGSLRGVNSLAASPDDRTLAAGTGEGVIRLWDLDLGQEVAALKGHRESVGQLAFSQDGRVLLSAGEEAVRTVRRWEAPPLTGIEAVEKARTRAASP
ncbi:MAG: hypothetical protein FJ387_18935 [Verrucomicrobia bacterium]|nr:hypothetical protein [Verrucomicrobiota bacterium]